MRNEEGWRVRSMVFERHSLLTENVAATGELTVAAFGEVAAESAAYLFGTTE